MRRPLKINDITVDPKWITTLDTSGNAFTKATGVFVLKLIECHSMRIKDLTKLSEGNIGDIRLKHAADLFSELLAPDRRWSKDAQRSGCL
ncbi:unnamed protein product, partial [Thlaspi arvense]